MANKIIIVLIAVALIATVFLLYGKGINGNVSALENYDGEITIYKSLTCGCCDVYASYFKNKGSSKVNAVLVQDVKEIKAKYGVPIAMESCHTTIIGDYFVEGHMPVQAIEKLLKEQPNISGIALPGMPMGSPGMVGDKKEDFVVYAVNKDGTYSEWMRI